MGNHIVVEDMYVPNSDLGAAVPLSNLVALNETLVHLYAGSIDVLSAWRQFLAQSPKMSNFYYQVQSMEVDEVCLSGMYHSARTTLGDYCRLTRYTAQCSLILFAPQKEAYDRFLALARAHPSNSERV